VGEAHPVIEGSWDTAPALNILEHDGSPYEFYYKVEDQPSNQAL
jgi:hypothetical protein